MDTKLQKLDRNLEKLLNHAYEIPEFREGFRVELLNKLKDSQRLKAARRKQRTTRITFAVGTMSGLAAAALVVLTLAPDLLRMARPGKVESTNPAQPGSTGVAPDTRIPVPAIAGHKTQAPETIAQAPDSPSRQNHDVMTVADTESSGGSTARKPGHAWNGNPAQICYSLFPHTRPSPRKAARTHDLVEIRQKPDTPWRRIGREGTFELADGTEIRTLPGATGSIGIWLDQATKLVMRPGSRLQYHKDHLCIRQGSALISLSDNANPLLVRISRRPVLIQPRSEVFFKIRGGEQFAAGGQPAPQIALIKGQASIRNSASTQWLAAGKIYELYDTPMGIPVSRDLCKLERKQVARHGIDGLFRRSFRNLRPFTGLPAKRAVLADWEDQ